MVRFAVPVLPPFPTLIAKPLVLVVIFEEIVWETGAVSAELVALIVLVDVANVRLPPERVMFDVEPVMSKVCVLTLPETLIVPVPSWVEEVPKFT